MTTATLLDPVDTAGAAGERILLGNALGGLEARFVAERLDSGATDTLLYVTRDAQRSTALAALVRFFAPGIEILTLPAWDCLPYDRVSPNATVVAERLATLHRLARERGRRKLLVLVSANALTQLLPPPDAVRRQAC